MREASLVKAGPGFFKRGDFLMARDLILDFLREWRSFFGGMREFSLMGWKRKAYHRGHRGLLS